MSSRAVKIEHSSTGALTHTCFILFCFTRTKGEDIQMFRAPSTSSQILDDSFPFKRSFWEFFLPDLSSATVDGIFGEAKGEKLSCS